MSIKITPKGMTHTVRQLRLFVMTIPVQDTNTTKINILIVSDKICFSKIVIDPVPNKSLFLNIIPDSTNPIPNNMRSAHRI